MIEPSINSLMEKVDSRYTLVIAVAKRARQLAEEAAKTNNAFLEKPVTIATREIAEGKITYVRKKNTNK